MEMPVFRYPEFLWLLLLVPVFFFSFRRKHSRSRGITVAVARGLIFSFLAVVLAQPNFRRSNDAVTTYFVLDQSGSIPEKLKSWSMNVVRQAVKEKRQKDRVGLIVFGDQAIVEESPTEHFEVDEIYSVVDNSNTDISAAVRLALSTFPDDTQKRIVLFTDGNETKGNLHAAVQLHPERARRPVEFPGDRHSRHTGDQAKPKGFAVRLGVRWRPAPKHYDLESHSHRRLKSPR